MISYRDMTFCTNPNCICGPERKLTDEVRAAADKWWGEPGAPISVGDVCGAVERCGARDGCTNDALEPHTCPYAKEISDDSETLCICCDDCTSECAEDI